MNRLLALIRREYWENKGSIRTTPLVMAGLYIVSTLMGVITMSYFDADGYTTRTAVEQLGEMSAEMRAEVLYQGGLASSVMFTVVMSFVVFFYLLGALYDDRKDRSILFWKSLPASDTLTIASKLLTAMVLIPLAFLAALILTHIVVGVIVSITLATAGGNPFTLLIAELRPLAVWGLIAASWAANSIWALPLYGWLLLVSAFAPRVPLLFATGPGSEIQRPLAIVIIGVFITATRWWMLLGAAEVMGFDEANNISYLVGYFDRDYGKSALFADKDVVIDASDLPDGITINWDGAEPARVLAVAGDLTLTNVAVTGGNSVFDVAADIGQHPDDNQTSTLARGAGIAVWGVATLTDCAIYDNHAVGDDADTSRDGGAYGGGVYADTVVMNNCVVSGNTVYGAGAAGGGDSGQHSRVVGRRRRMPAREAGRAGPGHIQVAVQAWLWRQSRWRQCKNYR